MAKQRIQREDANSKLSKAIASDSFQLHGLGTPQFVKAEEDKAPEKKPKTLKPPKTELEKWAREWKAGDPIPLIPVGHKLVLDVFPGRSKRGKLFQPVVERNRSLNEIGLIESKSVLGQTLNGMPGVSKLIAMVAKRRGIPVDDQGKLRCPAGTPAANQFTDLQMSNCMVPSAQTVAGNAAQTVAGAVSRALRGSMAGARTNIPDGDRDIVTVQTQVPVGTSSVSAAGPSRTMKLFGAAEAARRFLSFKKRHAYQKKIVSQYFGNVRDVQNARKALLKAFPNMDEASIKKFLEDYGDLIGKDLLDYIDSREEFITSLLYESLKNPEASKAKIAWIWSDQIGEDGNDGFAIDVTVDEERPFVRFNYNPRLWVENKKLFDENPDKYRDWLGIGYGNSPDEILSAREYGAYVGGHEFGHLADFYARFRRAGLDVDDTDMTNVWAEVQAKANVWGKTVDQLETDGDITPEQRIVHDAYETFIQEHQNAQTAADFDKAYEKLYDTVEDMLAKSSGLPDYLDEIIPDLVGSGYANQDNPIETHAEAYKVFSSIPEIIQQRIDKLNADRAAKGEPLIPPVNELSEMMFGLDITGMQPPDTGQAPKPGVIRRISRAARAAKDPNAPDDEDTNLDNITTNVVDDFVQNTQDNLQSAAERRKDRIRKNTLDRLFMHYSPEEINAVIAAIPKSQQGNNKYIASLLKVPDVIKKLRTPNGKMHSAEQEWRQLAALAINNDWLDFTAITDAHTLRGGKGPLRTILANTREQRRLINVARTQRAARRQASASARKLSGSVGAGSKPSYPREPTYGAFLGSADELFSEAKSWEEFAEIYKDKEIVFFDYETTGLVFDEFREPSSKGKPVQFGAIKIKNGKIIDRINVFMNPEEPLGEWSLKNLKDKDGNPLTDEWLQGQSSISEAHQQLIDFVGPEGIFGVQNASFDKDVLDGVLRDMGSDWSPSGYIDTREIAALTLPRWTPETDDGPFALDREGNKKPSSSLAAIAEYLGVDLGDGHHNADVDAEATSQVMQKIIDGAVKNGWSKDALDKPKRDRINKESVDKFNQELAQFKQAKRSFLSGSMSAGTERSVQKNAEIIEEIQGSTDFYNPDRLTTDMTDNVQRIVTPEAVAAIRQSINDMPVLSPEKQSELKSAVDRRGVTDVRSDMIALGSIFGPERVKREMSLSDGVMTHNPYYGPGLPLAIERELALASGDTEKAKKIDAFINYLNSATESQIIDDLTKSANDYGDGFDRRISVFIKEPQKFLDSGVYYTQFDIDARTEAGIFSTTGSGTDVRGPRRNAESTYGIPETLEDRLRPASGVIQQAGLGKGRRNKLKSRYGDGVQITEDYTIGEDVEKSTNVGRMFGTARTSINTGGRIILKPHVSERSRFTSSDSMAYSGSSGVEMASSESLRYGASALGFAKGDPLTGLLYHSMVDDGLSLMSPSVGTGTNGYNEALVPGSFSMDDVQAIVIDGSQFGRVDRAVGAKVRDNGSMMVGIMNPDTGNDAMAFAQFVNTRQRFMDEHGTTLILDSARLGGVDSVELFNPEMTQTFVKDVMPDVFPYIKDEDIKAESTVADMILLNNLRALQDGKTENTSFSKEIEEQLIRAEQEKNTDKFKELLEQGRLEAIQAVTEAINGKQREATTPNTGRAGRLSGSMSGGRSIKTGKVSRNPEDVVRSRPYSPIDKLNPETLGEPVDGIRSVDSFPVYTVGSKKLAFGSTQLGNQTFEFDDDVEILPLNPYAISNSSPDSDEGRNNAMTWWNATIGAILEDKDNAGYASALLYSSSRGDKDAEKELQRLASAGEAHIKNQQDEYVKQTQEEFADIDWFAQGDEYTRIYGDRDSDGRYQNRLLETKDLFAIHQTSYKPTIDENGNLILRPLEDFGDGRGADATGPKRFHRSSVHFSLNHLVQGHLERQSPTNESYAIITGVDSIMENNPDSLDNLFGVDTIFTPKPGEGIVMPLGTYRVVRLPSKADLGIEKWEPASGSIFNMTEEERLRGMREVIQFQEAQEQIINEMLQEMGKAVNGPDYKTKEFPGGMHGTTFELDRRIRYIASLLGARSTAHVNLPSFKYEKTTVFDDPELRNISNIASKWDMSINTILRLLNGDRLTTAKSEKQQTERRASFLPTSGQVSDI